MLGAVVVEHGCLTQWHYNWYHPVTMKHVHHILHRMPLLLVLKVLVRCPLQSMLLCVQVMVVLLLLLVLLLSMRM